MLSIASRTYAGVTRLRSEGNLVKRLACIAVALFGLSLAVAPASMAGGTGGPPSLVCVNPGGAGDGWGFSPGREHNLQICIDAGGHPAGPLA